MVHVAVYEMQVGSLVQSAGDVEVRKKVQGLLPARLPA